MHEFLLCPGPDEPFDLDQWWVKVLLAYPEPSPLSGLPVAFEDWFRRAAVWGAHEDPRGAEHRSEALAEWAVGQGLAEYAGVMCGGQVVYRWLVNATGWSCS
jgi:hypothetical protein